MYSIREKRPYFLEYRLVTKNDEVKWVHDQGKVVFEDGGPKYLDGVIFDISPQ